MYKNKFTPDTNLKGWLFTIMRNTFINNYRKNQHAGTSHVNTKGLYYLRVQDNHPFNSPDTRFEYKDSWKNVNEPGDKLLTPFKMHPSGYKYREIAEHVALPIGTVKNRNFHVGKEIQKKLTGD